MGQLWAGRTTTQAGPWTGARPESGARKVSQTWWSSKTRTRTTIWCHSCQTEIGVHITGLESLKNKKMKPGPGLGITARGSASSRGRQTSPTTTTAQSFVWRSTRSKETTEGSGTTKNVPIGNMLFAIKASKVGCLLFQKRLKRNFLRVSFLSTAQCHTTSCERGRCQETINNATCVCDPGFVGDRCHIGERAVL